MKSKPARIAGMDARSPPQDMDVLLADKRVRDSEGRDDWRPLAWAGKYYHEAVKTPRVGWNNPAGKHFLTQKVVF